MWLRKIIVATGTLFPEELTETFVSQITNEFTVYITPFTTNMYVLKKAKKACKCDDDLQSLSERFSLVVDGNFYTLEGNNRISKLLHFLNNPQRLYLDYAIGLPGGLGIDTENGIRYILHTKELRHTPHVHARYQGQEISIDLFTFKVTNSFKNPKKEKEAVDYVKSNRDKYLQLYNMKTNGIHIDDEFVENGVSTII